MTAAHAITPEQLEAMLERAAEAGAMKTWRLMQGELKRTRTKAAPVVIDDKTQAAANDALAARGLTGERRKRAK